jgi:hypothetical protein
MSDFRPGDIVSHSEMCLCERRMLQAGMNFGAGIRSTVILMSRRKGAPYEDVLSNDGTVLTYEGHDVARKNGIKDPKKYDQPRTTATGKLTQNGKFESAALDFKNQLRDPELVRVYEKVKDGIWTFNGNFRLTDAWVENKKRAVFKFRLELADVESPVFPETDVLEIDHTRVIPSEVKQEVWKRDKGKCVLCSRTDNLHFDHDLPFSKGGTSILTSNIRLLCARHNLNKSNRIE